MSDGISSPPSRVQLRLEVDDLDVNERDALREHLSSLDRVRAEFSPSDRSLGVGDIVLTIGGGAAATLVADLVQYLLSKGIKGRLSRKDDPTRSVDVGASTDPAQAASDLVADRPEPTA